MTTVTDVWIPPVGMQVWSQGKMAELPDGPWAGEPDKAQWVDKVTDLDCLIVRNRWGALCGYVGVPSDHFMHGADYNDVDVSVHGGLTFADSCDDEHPEGICHVPAPGRDANVWWLGFDCGHFMDIQPLMEVQMRELSPGFAKTLDEHQAAMDGFWKPTYKHFDYVIENCRELAFQLFELRHGPKHAVVT